MSPEQRDRLLPAALDAVRSNLSWYEWVGLYNMACKKLEADAEKQEQPTSPYSQER